jgi:hypothetical protein
MYHVITSMSYQMTFPHFIILSKEETNWQFILPPSAFILYLPQPAEPLLKIGPLLRRHLLGNNLLDHNNEIRLLQQGNLSFCLPHGCRRDGLLESLKGLPGRVHRRLSRRFAQPLLDMGGILYPSLVTELGRFFKVRHGLMEVALIAQQSPQVKIGLG